MGADVATIVGSSLRPSLRPILCFGSVLEVFGATVD
jgi:hypothetical protein